MNYSRFIAPAATACAVLVAGLNATPGMAQETDTRLLSPAGELHAELYSQNNQLSYSVSYKGQQIMLPSSLSMTLNGKVHDEWAVQGQSDVVSVNESWTPYWGQYNEIHDIFNEQSFDLVSAKDDSIKMQLTFRIFDDAVAFRFTSADSNAVLNVDEHIEFIPAQESTYTIPNGEFEPVGPTQLSGITESRHTFGPVLLHNQNVSLGIHESGLWDFAQIEFGVSADNTLITTTDTSEVKPGDAMPWRVVMVADHAADLNTRTTLLSLGDKPEQDFSWVKPGATVWDWRARGSYDNRLDNQTMFRMIDFAQENNFPHIKIDAGWYNMRVGSPLDPENLTDGIDVKKVIDYGKERGVGVWLYYDLAYVDGGGEHADFEDIARHFSDLGAVGVKYGFLGGRGPKMSGQVKTRETIRKIEIAARHNLMINFHDDPVPLSGVMRTYPNNITREYGHAQMDRRTSFLPGSFVKHVYVNQIAGPNDQSNGVFDIETVVHRDAGPRNDMFSTIASELARVVITHSGFLTLPDAPQAYEKRADALAYLSKLPTTWDDTVALGGEPLKSISIARRAGDEWFVGTVFDEDGGEMKLAMDFLEEGVNYTVEVFADHADTHYIENREQYTTMTLNNITRDSVINVVSAPGGGQALYIKPAAR